MEQASRAGATTPCAMPAAVLSTCGWGAQDTPVSITSHPAPDPNAQLPVHVPHRSGLLRSRNGRELRASATVWVSPEDDVELRKVVLVNRSDQVVELELISALEVTLASPAADEAHPAFSNLFVSGELACRPAGTALSNGDRGCTPSARCRPRTFVAATEGAVSSAGVARPTASTGSGATTPLRSHWPTLQAVPAAVAGPLDTGLDPVAVLGVTRSAGCRALRPASPSPRPASDDAATLRAVVDKYRQPSTVERASVMSYTLAGVQAVSHRPLPEYLPALQALTTALVLTRAQATLCIWRMTPRARLASRMRPPLAVAAGHLRRPSR